ncbi:hypothetical protein ACKAV7_007164 [Fusarium commune]
MTSSFLLGKEMWRVKDQGGPRRLVSPDMFKSNDYLRFDLEHPRQAAFVRVSVEDDLAKTGTEFKFACVGFRDSTSAKKYVASIKLNVELVPTKYNSREKMQKGVDDIVASMKKGRERFDAMGRTDPKQKQIDNTRQWKQTRSLTMDMFEKNGYLRFGLEYPQQAVNIPTKNCCTWSGSAQTVVGVPHQSTTAVKDGRGYRQGCGRNEGGAGVMGPQRVLNHGHVRSTIATATNLVDVGSRKVVSTAEGPTLK